MILVDTSAWIEHLRARDPRVADRLDEAIRTDEVVTTEVVWMEVLAGARGRAHARRLRRLLSRFELRPVHGLRDYQEAAALYRRCRAQGVTIRSLADCLVAAVAIREGLAVLHADRDFDALARHTDLEVVPL